MTKLRQLFRKIATLNIKLKYTVIFLALGVIHMIFTVSFAIGNMKPLFWYNVVAVLFYIYISFGAVKKERYIFAINAVYIEILVCAVFSCLMLGWNWGFSMYTLAMIPAMFYLTYTVPTIKSKIGFPTIMSAGIGACFILTRAVCGKIEPLYVRAVLLPNMQISFYYFNIIIAITVLLLFSTMFAMEIIYMQKQLEKENAYLGEVANIDPLTYLLNRRSMNIQLKNALENEKTFCIALMDIDDFKYVNDTYGHDCGDEVLVSVAQIISGIVQKEDAVCRWGGEEILVLINTDLVNAKKTAERICRSIRESTVNYEGNSVKITMTVGIAEYKKGCSIHDMITEADQNMYYGKQHGKNQVVTLSDYIEK